MVTVEIYYWHGTQLHGCPWEHGTKIECNSKAEYKKVVQKINTRCMDSGVNTMLLNNVVCHGGRTVVIQIDKGRFRQS